MKILSSIVKIFLNGAEKISLWAASFLFAAMLGIAFTAVILRYFVHFPLSWTEEILAFMMAWGVFLGGGTVVRRYGHIRLSFFAEKIFGRSRAPVIWTAVENLVGFGATTFVAYHGYRWVLHAYRVGAHGIGDIPYPFWVVRMVVVIGLGLMGLFYLERIVKQIQTRGRAGTEEQQSIMSTGDVLTGSEDEEHQVR
ncbi:TRAP transporter small permease [Chloroflexota bacterium]